MSTALKVGKILLEFYNAFEIKNMDAFFFEGMELKPVLLYNTIKHIMHAESYEAITLFNSI